MVVGAFHVSKRPGNFFEHHHKAKHGEVYYDVMSLSSHSEADRPSVLGWYGLCL